MDDTEKFKKYLKYLNKQLDKFQNDVKTEVLNKSLDDRLNVELAGKDKALERLQTCNELAYLLSSLVFIYQKLNCDKDMSNVVRELGRIQSYMSEHDQLQERNNSKKESTSAEEPVQSSISQQNFNKTTQPQGVHIKFQDNSTSATSGDTATLKTPANDHKDNELKDVSSQILEKLSKKHAGTGNSMRKKKGLMKAKKVSKD